LSQKLPQLKPRSLFSSQKGDTCLLSVVSHEYRHEQCQDEDGTEQIEHNEEEAVGWRCK
jgi:hypothetical protein